MRLKPRTRGLLPALLLCAGLLRAQPVSEYEIKAAFLYKFASFVQWPAALPGAPPAAARPMCIGVLGADRFGSSLDQIVRGKLVGGREFTVERLHSTDQALHCEIVFISSSEQSRIGEILSILRTKPVLTVSEVPGFCEKGGLINLKVADSAVRFEINVAAGERAGLRFSSKLLSLAMIVTEASP
jgi:hypothetical protein